jgi:S-DNA-T family DNA segregation ATPase FtsK/SpoIIIE
LTDNDVSQVVDFLKGQGRPVYNETILQEEPSEAGEVVLPGQDEPADEFYDQAVALVAKSKQPSISMIQRRLRIGYNRAARMIEQMEEQGIISPPNHQGQRQVLITDQSAS